MNDKTKKENDRTIGILTIIVGFCVSLISFLNSIDGVYSDHGKIKKTYYKAIDPEGFWNTVQVDMAIGGIIAGVGFLFIYLQKEEQKSA